MSASFYRLIAPLEIPVSLFLHLIVGIRGGHHLVLHRGRCYVPEGYVASGRERPQALGLVIGAQTKEQRRWDRDLGEWTREL
jgi:hypothetical protein